MKIFFSHGDGVEFPALLLQPLCAADLERRDPQETGREGKKNGTKGYMLLWIVGRDLSLSLSLPPLLFSLFPQRTLIRRSRGRRVFVPTIVRPDNGPEDWSFDSVPVVDSFFSSLFHDRRASHSTIDREKFHSSLVKLSHCPGLSLVSRGSATGCPVIVRITWNRAIQRGETYFSLPPPRLDPLCAPASDVFPGRRRDERGLSSSTESIYRGINSAAERRRGWTKGGGRDGSSSGDRVAPLPRQRGKRGHFNCVFRLVSALFSASIIGRVIFEWIWSGILIRKRIKCYSLRQTGRSSIEIFNTSKGVLL